MKPIFSIQDMKVGNIIIFGHHEDINKAFPDLEEKPLYLVCDVLDNQVQVCNIGNGIRRMYLNHHDFTYDPEDNWNYYLL